MLSKVSVPRCYFDLDNSPNKVQIHGFCDASKQAYAAVLYIRCTYQDEYFDTNLVISKMQVASIKKQTIP